MQTPRVGQEATVPVSGRVMVNDAPGNLCSTLERSNESFLAGYRSILCRERCVRRGLSFFKGKKNTTVFIRACVQFNWFAVQG